jgi:hypothetical protein
MTRFPRAKFTAIGGKQLKTICFHFFAWRANFRGFVYTIPGEKMGRFFEGMVGAPLGKTRGPDGFRDAGRRHRFFRFARHWDTCRVEEMDRFEGA